MKHWKSGGFLLSNYRILKCAVSVVAKNAKPYFSHFPGDKEPNFPTPI